MERFQELSESARKKLKTADHILSSTYEFVQDPRLLMSAIETIFLSMSYSMGALLHFEKYYKKIPNFTDKFEHKYSLFIQEMMPKYGFDSSYAKMMRELKQIIIDHQKSPVEFVKGDYLVICDDNYSCRKIGPEQIKKYLYISKQFNSEILDIISSGRKLFR